MRSESDLRDTQKTMIEAMCDSAQQMFVAGMGAGKTVSILTGFKRLQDAGEVRSGIILAPPRVVDIVWPREHLKWEHLHDLDVCIVRGGPGRREKLMASGADLYVISLDVIKWLADLAATWPNDDPRLDFLAIDEISKLREPRSKLVRYGFDKNLWQRFDSIYGATGTIKPNGYEDLWNPYRIISQGSIWHDTPFDEWRREQFMPLDHKGYNWRIHTFMKPVLDRKVGMFTTAVEADLDLPDLNIGPDWDIELKLHPETAAAYESMLKELLVEVGYDEHLEPDMVAALSAAIQSGKLAQIAQGFVMDRRVDEGGEKVESKVMARYPNVKLDWLKAEVEDLQEAGENVVVCYYFREDLRQLQAAFPQAKHLGSGISPGMAVKTIDQWNAGKLPVLLAHPASVGHGVELQWGGRLMIWYTPTWSSEQYDQMVKRLHRPGQTRPVISRRLLATDTVTDVVKVNRVENKMSELRLFEKLLKEFTDART